MKHCYKKLKKRTKYYDTNEKKGRKIPSFHFIYKMKSKMLQSLVATVYRTNTTTITATTKNETKYNNSSL